MRLGQEETVRCGSSRSKSLVFNALCQKSMIDLGYGTSKHIYDIPYSELENDDSPQRVCLLFAKRFFDSLDAIEQKIYIAEVLEKGRYYKYWYTPFYTYKSYLKRRNKLFGKLARYLG